ncbi:MAG: AbrB/MazE/SpoVT family DNA-binding domain-containing protein [Nitrososphaerota archaeon]|nr:AbrB/MazE/SpoVT family DNA-binding domain-containing protein [Nitrososphaerota archaeon]
MPVEFEVKVVKVGNSLRMTIPKEVCRALSLSEGSTVGIVVSDSTFHVRKVK